MRILLVLLTFFILPEDIHCQTYAIGHRQVSFIDTARNNRQVQTEIYYPSDVSGEDTPFSADESGFPVLVFGHGFVMEWGAYANIWNAVVPEGYIIAFPRTETGISPDHLTFARDIAFVVGAIQEEGNTVGSPFFGRVDTASCVMGHSMGGGSSFLAIQFNPSITAIVNFAAAETNPSAIAAAALVNIPALLFAGSNDCITPPVTNQEMMFDSLGSACKTLVSITGASHCQFAEQNVLCSFGELTCSPAPTISRDEQHRLVDTLLIPWLDAHLKGDCTSSAQFQNILDSGAGWSYRQQYEPCITAKTDVLEESVLLEVYPVPSSGNFYIKSTSPSTKAELWVFNAIGHMVYHQSMESDMEGIWHCDARLTSGVYYLQVSYAGRQETIKMIIQ